MNIQERWQKIDISSPQLILWGAADQFRVNYPILIQLGFQIKAIIDDTPGKKSPIDSIPIFQGESGLNSYLDGISMNGLGYIVAVCNPYSKARLRLHNLLRGRGLTPISFADPSALICRTVVYGVGLQVMPMVLIGNNVTIGDQCIIQSKAFVEHDCVLGNGVEIGPGGVLCGRVTVGENTWIGANATIRQRINIGANSIIGAGAVVVQDVPDNVVVAGVPAKIIKENVEYE